MPPLFRQLVVPVVLTVALAASAMAQADSVTVVTFGPEGFRLQAPDDVPVGEGKAVMLRRMGESGWAMTTLNPGDVPSEVAETMRLSRSQYSEGEFPRGLREHPGRFVDVAAARSARESVLAQMPRMTGEVFEFGVQRSVLFEITARLGQLEMDDALVRQLSETEALRRLEISESVDSGTVEARFVFDSVEDWNAWKAAPETVQMLDALKEATLQMQTRMEIRQ